MQQVLPRGRGLLGHHLNRCWQPTFLFSDRLSLFKAPERGNETPYHYFQLTTEITTSACTPENLLPPMQNGKKKPYKSTTLRKFFHVQTTAISTIFSLFHFLSQDFRQLDTAKKKMKNNYMDREKELKQTIASIITSGLRCVTTPLPWTTPNSTKEVLEGGKSSFFYYYTFMR